MSFPIPSTMIAGKTKVSQSMQFSSRQRLNILQTSGYQRMSANCHPHIDCMHSVIEAGLRSYIALLRWLGLLWPLAEFSIGNADYALSIPSFCNSGRHPKTFAIVSMPLQAVFMISSCRAELSQQALVFAKQILQQAQHVCLAVLTPCDCDSPPTMFHWFSSPQL